MATDQVTARLVGLDELAKGNRHLVDEIGETAETELRKAGEIIARSVASRVPHLTGRLAGGVGVTSVGGHISVGHIGGVPYAGFIEFGGRGRQRIPTGRYLFPIVQGAQARALVQHHAETAAETSIERMRWPKPRA